MNEISSYRDRYLTLIDEIVQTTLKGQIRSKAQVYQLLLAQVETGTGEIFERALESRLSETQAQAQIADELKQAKAQRRLRALQTIQGEWQRWQTETQASQIVSTIATGIQSSNDAIAAIVRALDPNQPQAIELPQLQQLAKTLSSNPDSSDIAIGLQHGIVAWQRLEDHLISWMYDSRSIGFAGSTEQPNPWRTWAKQVDRPILRSLFEALARNESPSEWASHNPIDAGSFVELLVTMQRLQQGLVRWFDKQLYDAKSSAKLSIATYLAFAVIWSQLASGSSRIADDCFQVTLQILRQFAQRDYFPLYGGVFASFSGESLRDALSYLDEPLRRAEGTQEKARILTLLGYSARIQGRLREADAFHQQAIDLAREAGDRVCEVANFNHLSRAAVAQTDYESAIRYGQRAVVLSRQAGDRIGEANALANLGYSEVLQAQQSEYPDPDRYESAIGYLEQGLKLAERQADRASQALCHSSLGIAYVVLERSELAIEQLGRGLQAAQFTGDLYLQGLNLAYLGEAYWQQKNSQQSILTASLGMYLLEQSGSNRWRQSAGLLTVWQGQLGEENFMKMLEQNRTAIVSVIGVDGYDHLPELIRQYQQ
ncbi:tetratricopeptide repeat protein [Microcoleus sp. FACHB-1515]|uniref:tetratricopeptide repeat protein n=1 Tax=Cyanophyceae TaxID=3028117 RepID=UPI001685B181|nr:tetratricopeptide repeat protein [Microcoleus sp. FACHB-1515]MBD2090125.1 tetratricopeptide repeat protein [Microcoleus sp. FACHB-1515]